VRFESFARHHGLDPDETRQRLIGAVSAVPGEVALLTGSLVEGLGNLRSDIDVYWVTDRPVETTFANALVCDMGAGVAADIEVFRPNGLRDLLSRFADIDTGPNRDVRRSATSFSLSELKLLHNLRIGIPLWGADGLEALQLALDSVALARTLLDLAHAHLDMLHSDILGALGAGEITTARHLLRAFRNHLAGALLAGLGETNPAEKWRPQKLTLARAAHGDIQLPGGRPLSEMVDEIENSDARIGTDDPYQVFRRLLAASWSILPWAETLLSGAAPRRGNRGSVQTRPSGGGRPLPALSLECRVGCDSRGVWLSALRSPQILYLGPLAHDLLPCFDGETSIAGAVRQLSQRSSASCDELRDGIQDFARVLEAYRLV
jgi:hypothetical protein